MSTTVDLFFYLSMLYYFAVSYSIVKIVKWLIKYVSDVRKVNKINGPAMLPIIGNTHHLDTKDGLLFDQAKISANYRDKPFYRVWLGTKPLIMFHKADELEVLAF